MFWSELTKAVLLSIAFVAVFVLMEALKRKFKLSPELTRRFAHLMSGFFALLDFFLVQPLTFVIMLFSGLAFISISHWKNIFTSIHNVKRSTLGEVYLPIGQILTYFLAQGNVQVFVQSILIITFADSLAGLTSDLFKAERKMVRGSIVFFAATLAILRFTSPAELWWLIVISLALTFVERFSPKGTDNITVPVAASLLLLL